MHRNLIRIFRLYMLVGGMPQTIETYLEQNNLQAVDEVKREIIDLYEEDFAKIDGTGLVGDLFDAIPASDKVNLVEVKSGNYRGHKSLDVFCAKFSHRIKNIVYTKDYKWENGIHYLPV